MSIFIKYYAYISLFYILEITIFFLLKDILINFIFLNFIIRFVFVVLTSQILKNNVFKRSSNFYAIFYIVAFLNPVGSSFFLFLLTGFVLENLLIGKFISDVIVSFLSFTIINFSNKNK